MFKFLPTTLTDCRLIAAVQKLSVLGTVAENGISVLVCKQKEKSEKNPTKRRQKKIAIRGDVCGDYDYGFDDHYYIKQTGRLQQQPTNPGH